MPEDNGGLVIGMREIYDEVKTLSAKVDGFLATHAQDQQHLHSQGEDIKDHEARIRKLEAWRYALPTTLILATGSTVVSFVVLLMKII